MLLSAIRATYDSALTPIAPFTWFGSTISTFDVAAALRLCIVLRQLRESALRAHHLKAKKKLGNGSSGGEGEKEGEGADKLDTVEDRSYVKCIATTLVTVYGGEAIMCPWLGLSPSFVFSPVVPALYASLTVLVELAPSVPEMSLLTELPLSFMDGLTRAFLLCQLIPPSVTTHAHRAIAESPWTLLLASLITANGGFFFVNLFSMLSPTGYTLRTPAELGAYGWTTVDLWCAPLVTGLYALLTHAQPAWAAMHAVLVEFVSGSGATRDVRVSGKDESAGIDLEELSKAVVESSLNSGVLAEASAEAESFAAAATSATPIDFGSAESGAEYVPSSGSEIGNEYGYGYEKGLLTTFTARTEPVDAQTARAACAVLLAALFSMRTLKNFGATTRPSGKTRQSLKQKSRKSAVVKLPVATGASGSNIKLHSASPNPKTRSKAQ